MATYYTLLTKIGQASIANAVALNKPVNLTSMAVGDGNGNPTTPSENQTALVREKYRAQINQLTVDPDNPNYLIAEMIIPTTVGGWSIYEVGVFDDQSQLVAVANFPATYKPELAEGSGRDLIVRIVIQVSNASVVTLKIDPAITLASQAWVAANYVKKITVAGGTTGQVLAKKSNANEDFKWVDPTAAVQVIVDSQTEEQTLASGQTIINLAKLTTQATAIYVEGVRLYPTTHYTINSDTRLTLKTSYPTGSKVLAVQNDPTSSIAMASLTEKGFTILSSTPSDDETKAATPKSVLSVSPGRLLNVQKILVSGTYTPTPGTKKALVEVVGAGGGGQGAGVLRTVGGGGGSGAYVLALITNLAASYPVTVGTGGIGTTATAAGSISNSGGSTTFGSFITCGGGGGGVADMTTAATTGSSCIAGGGQPGAVTTVDTAGVTIITAMNGSRGSFGTAVHPNYLGGNGGVSPLGSGGKGGATAPADATFNASGYGAGGGGNTSVYAAASGGNGASGVVIVWEYA